MEQLHGIWGVIGHTPLVRLERLFPDLGLEIYGKLEFLNPGGSAKDRAAFRMVRNAVTAGLVTPGGVVVESSSGNMGIALAQACRYFGLRLVCVVDYRTTLANRKVLEAYGAEVDVVNETVDPLSARIERVRELVSTTPRAYWPNQYVNEDNPAAHSRATAIEITDVLGKAPDALFCPVSTCGTISGLDEGMERAGGGCRVYAVDLFGSALFSDSNGLRHIPGIGSSRKRHFHTSNRVHPVHVTDRDCVVGCRLLVEREAIFAGGSTGAVVSAAARVCRELPAGSKVVLIFPDRGDRYLDTIYNDEWVEARLPPAERAEVAEGR